MTLRLGPCAGKACTLPLSNGPSLKDAGLDNTRSGLAFGIEQIRPSSGLRESSATKLEGSFNDRLPALCIDEQLAHFPTQRRLVMRKRGRNKEAVILCILNAMPDFYARQRDPMLSWVIETIWMLKFCKQNQT